MESADSPRLGKRKAVALECGQEDWDPFQIQFCVESSLPRCLDLTPLRILPLGQPLLELLDLPTNNKIAVKERICTSHVSILEGDSSRSGRSSVVLVARAIQVRAVLAIERICAGLYCVHHLKQTPWDGVSTDKLITLPEPFQSSRSRRRQRYEHIGADSEWWHVAAVELDVERHHGSHGPDGMATIFLEAPPIAQAAQQSANTSSATSIPTVETSSCSQAGEAAAVKEAAQQSEEALRNVNAQYQETLYLSKASLAYFAKGPLSRARAVFSTSATPGNAQSPLIEHLRTMVLDVPIMDKKYRETVPQHISNLPNHYISENDQMEITEASRKKRRKSKNAKIGKDGLFSGEDEKLVKWWHNELRAAITSEMVDTEDRRNASINDLKTRDTKLQIILVLEILALESASIRKDASLGSANVQDDHAVVPKRAKKKTQNLRLLLDILADRLCIWQSMTISPKKASANSKDANTSKDTTQGNSVGVDHLRQFCVDVVVPFYAARLSEESSNLCQKLGGPKEQSPQKPGDGQSGSNLGPRANPRATSKRQSSQKNRRTLERVLTDEKGHSRRGSVPSLSRSSTEPCLNHIKREVNDTSLSSIPLNRVVMKKRYTQREVDLRVKGQANETRMKKKEAVDQELKGAIAALKKPNARKAVKEFVEAAEKRQPALQAKRARKPEQNPFMRNVQIHATPSKHEQRRLKRSNTDIFDHESLNRNETTDLDEVQPSSVLRVPASVMALNKVAPNAGTTLGIEKRSSMIAQTPTRGPTKFLSRALSQSDQVLYAEKIPSLPTVLEQSASVTQGLSLPPTSHSGFQLSLPNNTIAHETPRKSATLSFESPGSMPLVEATPCKQVQADTERHAPSFDRADEKDLYASLGWNDDINIDL